MTTIHKKEIYKEITASNDHFNSVQVQSLLDQFLDTIATKLKDNDKIQFTGFGSFNAKNVPARKGRNPQTGAEIQIAARREVRFSAGAELKDKVNN